MMGRIKALHDGNAGGAIKAENGQTVSFDVSAVMAYDVACLAVGRTVSFDLDGPHGSSAVNVCVRRLHPIASVAPQRAPSLRFLGFAQERGIRSFKFERERPGEDIQTLIVTADLALFTRHRVPIQEGPAMCIRLLQSEGEADRERHSLTEEDLIDFLAARVVPLRTFRRRVPRANHGAPAEFTLHNGA